MAVGSPRAIERIANFVRSSSVDFPDLNFSDPGKPALTDDSRAAYVPWRMTATNTGSIDPPGFAATGNAIALNGFDIWQFRDMLIWR